MITLLREPADMARALALLVSGFPAAEQQSYLTTLGGMVSRPQAAEELIVFEAREGKQRTGVALARVLPGRAALVWPIRPSRGELAAKLLSLLLNQLQARKVAAAHATTTLEQQDEFSLLRDAGFTDGGQLHYMAATEAAFLSDPPPSDLTFEIVPPDEPELARIVMASYQRSLDCPLLDGWRTIDDVLTGYQATGTFRPELWRLIRSGSNVVGCLLMSDFPEQAQGELTYLGIDPKFRGKGFGLMATRWLLHFGRQTGWRHILLAVDAQNVPAQRIYSAAGFRRVAVRRLLALRFST
jgi:RimJ/RimL family protein N-acetyltransferase